MFRGGNGPLTTPHSLDRYVHSLRVVVAALYMLLGLLIDYLLEDALNFKTLQQSLLHPLRFVRQVELSNQSRVASSIGEDNRRWHPKIRQNCHWQV